MFQTICRVSIFLICAQAVIRFCPKEAYEKYLKLLVSILVMVQLIFPVTSFLFGKDSQDFMSQLEGFQETMDREMGKPKYEEQQMNRILEKMTAQELKKYIEEQNYEDQIQMIEENNAE